MSNQGKDWSTCNVHFNPPAPKDGGRGGRASQDTHSVAHTNTRTHAHNTRTHAQAYTHTRTRTRTCARVGMRRRTRPMRHAHDRALRRVRTRPLRIARRARARPAAGPMPARSEAAGGGEAEADPPRPTGPAGQERGSIGHLDRVAATRGGSAAAARRRQCLRAGSGPGRTGSPSRSPPCHRGPALLRGQAAPHAPCMAGTCSDQFEFDQRVVKRCSSVSQLGKK
jgi:hypothetical protein